MQESVAWKHDHRRRRKRTRTIAQANGLHARHGCIVPITLESGAASTAHTEGANDGTPDLKTVRPAGKSQVPGQRGVNRPLPL
ncbi:hypothetical protein GCM10027202_32260 [Microvirgula curvata]